ncbi:hypothetical protein [Enhygromyxa salina]|uniref:hypothetical protein n=1 Tax=Enhygromyxa salina TaxID=215803 RepID=UPI0011B1CB27|nr:hypothetical protein [Enhygromyxa salina]
MTPPRGRQAHTAWLFGALTLPIDEARERGTDWLLSLNVTAISQIDQVPQIAALCRISAFHDAPRWRPLADGLFSRVTFALDLDAAFAYPLRPEPTYVHVSGRELCSDIVELGTDEAPIAEPGEDVGSRLVAAYTAGRAGEHIRAVELFEALLEQRELRLDVDACHLYNGACVLARAGLYARALAWLREDSERRVRAHTRAVAAWLASDFTDGPGLTQRHTLEVAMREHFAVVERDHDLDSFGTQRSAAALLELDPEP